jgi:hypothetical protein
MENVYEVKVKREVYITDYIEVDEHLDIENEEVKEILRQTYCHGIRNYTDLGRIHNSEKEVVSLEFEKSNEKPQKIFNVKSTGHYVSEDEDGNLLDPQDEYWVVDGEVGIFNGNFTPENTKSVLYYEESRFRRTTPLPNDILYFPFSIEREELEKLWKKGDLKKLSQYLIKPTEQIQRNPVNTYNKIFDTLTDNWGEIGEDMLEKIDGNSPYWFNEMYKRKDKEEVKIEFFTNQEWKRMNFPLGHLKNREKGYYCRG